MKTGNLSEYTAIIILLDEIDCHLENGTRHYHNKAGRLLWTLDQVVWAILADDLVTR